ncbi:MAG: glycosyltransferase [Synergistaceae bacterium]|nr:glycosyltransferase [Synergistaceae bacterium]
MKNRAAEFSQRLMHDNRSVSVDIWCLVYNHEKYLHSALDGMLMQRTNFPYRIIIHDDASTDNSAKIIKEYQRQFPDKIIAIFEAENQMQKGVSFFRKMLANATAKYIAYCEGDDYWIDKNKLQKQVTYLETHQDCVSCYHNILPVNEFGQYDESLRKGYVYLKDGDYTKKEIRSFVLKTQLASLVMKNYLTFFNENDIQVYQGVKCNGDRRILLLCGILGRVHYLSDVMAAHRRVFYGDSYTARLSKKSTVDIFINEQKGKLEIRRLYKYFTGKPIYPYNDILHAIVTGFLLRQFCIKNGDHKKIFKEINLPFYAFFIYVPFFFYKCLLKTWKIFVSNTLE